MIGGPETFFVEVPEQCTLDGQCTALTTNPCEAGICKLNGFCEYSPIEGCQNGGLLETWTGIGGNSVSSLLADPRFPNSPDETKILPDFLEAPKDYLNDFGSRLQTYLKPPVTCDYTFYIASDDEGVLNLSNNTNPANKKTIASHTGVCGYRLLSNQLPKLSYLLSLNYDRNRTLCYAGCCMYNATLVTRYHPIHANHCSMPQCPRYFYIFAFHLEPLTHASN